MSKTTSINTDKAKSGARTPGQDAARLRRREEAERLAKAESAEAFNRELARSRAETGTFEDEPPLSEQGQIKRQQLLSDVANRFERLEREKSKMTAGATEPSAGEYDWRREQEAVMRIVNSHPEFQRLFQEELDEDIQ